MTTTPTIRADSHALFQQLLYPSHRADPYPLYAELRQHGPFLLPAANLAVFSAYRHCDEVLRHHSSSNDYLNSTEAQRAISNGQQIRPLGPPGFLFLDAPDHTRLRKLVSKAFVPKVVNALKPDISALVDGLLDRIAEQGQFDVVRDFAYPLPVAVICRLLGVPLDDEPHFSQASSQLAHALDPFVSFNGESDDGVEERQRAGRWLRDYLRGLIEQRRSRPGDDLMSGLVAVEEAGDQLTTEEIVATCQLLLIAGHETTVNLIANAILAMLRHRPQWIALGADASRAAAVVEETMRYDPPVQLTSRIALEDMTIGEITVPKGDTMMLLLAAAQRDGTEFVRPDVFDPDRGTVRHLGFGLGAHYCLGAPLARLEASVALAAVTARFPDARLLDSEPHYKPNLTLRGLSELAVAV